MFRIIHKGVICIENDFVLQSIQHIDKILQLFSKDVTELGVSEISKATKLSKSTVHRTLVSLKNIGLLKQSQATLKYSLGYRILYLSNILQDQLNYQDIALPVMRDLRDKTNETIAFHLFDGSHRICLFQIESKHELRRTYTDIGKPLPLYPGSPGKVILANLKSHEREEFIKSFNLDSESERILREELQTTFENGYALSLSERTKGIASISAPVFDAADQVVAVINISGPDSRVTKEKLNEFIDLLIPATKKITERLIFRNNS